MGCAPCPALAGVGWSGHGCLGARASGKIRDTGRCQVTPLCEAGHSESTMLRVITCPLGIVMTPLGHHTQVKLCVGETKCVGCLGGPGVGALRSSPRPLCGSGLELPWGTRDGVCRRGGARSQPVCALPGQPSRTEACLLSQARPPAPPQGARRAVQGQQTSASGTSRPLPLAGRPRAVPHFVCPFSFSAAVGSGGVSCMPVPLLDASRPSCPLGSRPLLWSASRSPACLRAPAGPGPCLPSAPWRASWGVWGEWWQAGRREGGSPRTDRPTVSVPW